MKKFIMNMMYGLLECERFSLRSFDDVFKDSFFQLLFNQGGKLHISYSSNRTVG